MGFFRVLPGGLGAHDEQSETFALDGKAGQNPSGGSITHDRSGLTDNLRILMTPVCVQFKTQLEEYPYL